MNKVLYFKIISIGTLAFFSVLLETSLNIAFPNLKNFFSKNYDTLNWLTTGYLLTSTFVVATATYLQNRYSEKYLFIASWITFFIGCILSLISNNFYLLLLARCIEGIGSGIAIPLLFLTVITQTPSKKVGSMMALATVTIASAPAIGPVYGGLIIHSLNWKYMFLFPIPFLLISMFIGVKYLSNVNNSKIANTTLKGIVGVSILLTGILILINKLLINFWHAIIGLTLIFVGYVIIKFKSIEFINIKFIKNKYVFINLIIFSLLQFFSLSLSYLIPTMVQTVFKIDALNASFVVIIGSFMNALFVVIGGFLLDRLGIKIIYIGLLLNTFSFTLSLFTYMSVLCLAITYGLFMIGLGLSYGNIMTNTLTNTHDYAQTDVNTVFSTMQTYTGSLGVILTGTIVTLFQNSYGLVRGIENATLFIFSIFFILSILELIFFNITRKYY